MELYKHQKQFIDTNPRATLLCWDTGIGKTRASIEWLKINLTPGKNALIICTKTITENWIRQLKQWMPDEFGSVQMLDPNSRVYVGPQITVMTKEHFKKTIPFKKRGRRITYYFEDVKQYDIVIVDEAHYFSGQKSQSARALIAYMNHFNVPHRLLLTATPYLSTPWNIYQLASILGHNWNAMDFEGRYFTLKYVGRSAILIPRSGIEEDMARLVRHIGNVVRIDECIDVPEQTDEVEFFSLTKEQQDGIKGNIAENPVVRYTKNHQIENGTLKSDGYTEDAFFPNHKLSRILELAQENKKMVVVCRYNLQITQIARALDEMGKRVFILNGAVTYKDSIVQAVEKSDDCVMLINASCSEGYELPSVALCVFASLSFSYKDYKQMRGRFLRINKPKKNVYLHLVCPDGVDQGVYDSIQAKKDFDITIYARNRK